jgi:hypothetical protein
MANNGPYYPAARSGNSITIRTGVPASIASEQQTLEAGRALTVRDQPYLWSDPDTSDGGRT